jgi:acyl carrier protein
MTVSSRTPEGLPSHCPLCGAVTNLEFSDPAGDAPCPNCGYLLRKSNRILSCIRNSLAKYYSIPISEIEAKTLFEDLRNDSIDLIELLIELEDECDIVIPDEDYSAIRTVGDLIRYVINQQTANPQ